MHYKDGTEAKHGDVVSIPGTGGSVTIGIVHALTPGATSCNGIASQVARIIKTDGATIALVIAMGDHYFTVGEASKLF